MGLVNLNPSNVAVNIAEDIRNPDTATTVSATTTVVVALAANPNRIHYSIYNAGTQTVFMRENSTVTATLYKQPIPPGFVCTPDDTGSRYVGAIAVITASGTSNLMISESTAA
jgi:hypothetical protein